MMTEEPKQAHDPNTLMECDACGSDAVRMSREQQRFSYGKPGEQVELVAEVTVWRCEACDIAFTDGDAEDARHDAVCRYLRVLTPREIQSLRARYRLSQADLAELTGFGEASIKRWELGLTIQNQSADRFLRLLQDPDTFEKLSRLSRQRQDPPEHPKRRFQTRLPPSAFHAAKTFELRRHVA